MCSDIVYVHVVIIIFRYIDFYSLTLEGFYDFGVITIKCSFDCEYVYSFSIQIIFSFRISCFYVYIIFLHRRAYNQKGFIKTFHKIPWSKNPGTGSRKYGD